MKLLYRFFIAAFCVLMVSCSDEPGMSPGLSGNDREVTVNPDGSTSSGVQFYMADDKSFFLDHILYEIVDAHLEIVGYETEGIAEHVRPYAYINLWGTKYPTRVVRCGFYNCKRIRSCELPATITTLTYKTFSFAPDGHGAFEGCVNLEYVSFPKGIKEIGERSFYGCSSLKAIKTPSSLESIKDYAFSGCTALSTLDIANGIKYIKGCAFQKCSSLINVTLPPSLLEVLSPFPECERLQSITLTGTGIKEVLGLAVYSPALQKVTLPEGVESVSLSSFYGCPSLTTITCMAPEPPVFRKDPGCMFNPKDCVLRVPARSVRKYQETLGEYVEFKRIEAI